jgi:DNA-binding SARP family transcriptional activator
MVQQYDFANNKWDTIQSHGEVFHPRMHAAIGKYADTLYILGGFGSKSGDQILKPEHYTDLLAFSIKEREFTKKYEFLAPMDDIDFAHSMVINEEDQSYYLLATTIFEYETYLQLLRGNLADPELILLGDKMPYLFHNENSYCDLFYSKSSQELIATTYLSDIEKNETKISVYKISFPPYFTDMETDENRSRFGKMVFVILFLLIVVAMVIVLRRIMKNKVNLSNINEAGKENDKSESDHLAQNSILQTKPKLPANSLQFFGGFQVINKHGDDITKKFTPLLKELFLVIFLHSIKDKGISVPKLTDLLWFSMDTKTAKNNRAVNIAKLKHLLSEIDSCSVNRNTSYWQVEFNDSIVYNDYWSCIKSIDNEQSRSMEDLQQFLCLIKKGPLLGNASYEWLDEFKLECSNMIIDSLSHFVEQDKIGLDPELMIQLADAILIFDMMHEEAITIKCRSLNALGKHSLAKDIFVKFSKDYFTLYDEPFDRSFTDIIKNQEDLKDWGVRK